MNVAFIPVRGGSKSIPLKNIKIIAGKPLIYWTVVAACGCSYIDKVYVATDSKKIKSVIEDFKEDIDQSDKVIVVERSEESATDTASTELAMLEFARKTEFDNIVLIQATSPLLTSADLSGGFKLFLEEKTDSVLSVVRQKRFCWKIDEKKLAYPINYDVYARPRRQEFEGYLVENGAFYITDRVRLLQSGNRISGNIRAYEMDEGTYYELDEPADWLVVEQLLLHRINTCEKESFPEIKIFLTDCDGCLTNGGMYYSEYGDELKCFNSKDGMGFQLLREKGIITGIITGEKIKLNRVRGEKLHVDVFEDGIQNKLPVVKSICERYGIQLKNVAYVGDDINDLEVIEAVGFGCCVADGVDTVKQASDYVTQRFGGQGAVREVIDYILKRKNNKICWRKLDND